MDKNDSHATKIEMEEAEEDVKMFMELDFASIEKRVFDNLLSEDIFKTDTLENVHEQYISLPNKNEVVGLLNELVTTVKYWDKISDAPMNNLHAVHMTIFMRLLLGLLNKHIFDEYISKQVIENIADAMKHDMDGRKLDS